MKKPATDTSILPMPDAVPTLSRAVRKSRRAPVALRPMDPAISGLEAALHHAVETLIQEETQRMSRRVYARLPGTIARLLAVSKG
jgi:hypothetical protein